MMRHTAARHVRDDLFRRPMPLLIVLLAMFCVGPVNVNVALAQQTTDISVIAADVVVEGGFGELTDATEEQIAPYRGRRATVEQLYELAGKIELLYQKAGYFLVRVTIPPQEINDGDIFRLAVVDGYLEDADVQGVPVQACTRVISLLQPVIRRHRLTMEQFERALMLANETPGTTVRTTLAAGNSAGSSLLIVDADYKSWTGSISVSSPLFKEKPAVGKSVQVQFNQPFGHGEQIRVHASGQDANSYTIGAGARWPLGNDGYSIDLSASRSLTSTPALNIFIPAARADYQRYALELSKPLQLGRTRELRVLGSLEAVGDVLEAPDFPAVLHEDRLRVLRIGANVMKNVPGGSRLTLLMQHSQGIAWGVRTMEDALETGIHFSRPGATPLFRKLSLTAAWRLPFASRYTFTSTLRGQYTLTGPLPTTELFSISSGNALPAVAVGVGAGDHGWTLREEVEAAYALFDGTFNLTPVAYVAIGSTHDHIADRQALATAVGLGVRGDVGRARLSLDYGRGWSKSLSADSFIARVEVIF